MQVQADWEVIIDLKYFEEELNEEFKGPGWYMRGGSTMLVVPYPLGEDADQIPLDRIWHIAPKFNSGEPCQKVTVLVWNCSFQNTIFAYIAPAPVRLQVI